MTATSIRLRVLPRLIPVDGKNVELRTTATEIQWRVEGDASWQTLTPLSAIKGDPGPKGDPGADGGGVPTGGTTSQVLSKASDTDGDVQWSNAGAGDVIAANNGSDFSDPAAVRTNIGVGYQIAKVGDIPSANVAAPVNIISTRGVSAEGDGSLPYYKRAASEPTHALKKQSGDSAWWEYYAWRGALSANEVGMSPSLSASDTVTAWDDANAYCVAKGIPMVVEPGFRTFDSPLKVGNGVEVVGLDGNFTRFISTISTGDHAVVIGGVDGAHKEAGVLKNIVLMHNDVASGGPGKGTTAAKGLLIKNTARNRGGVLQGVTLYGFGAAGLELDEDFTNDVMSDVNILQCGQNTVAQGHSGLVMNSTLTPYSLSFRHLTIEECGFFGEDYASSAYGGAIFGYMGGTRKGSISFDRACTIQGNFGQSMVYLDGFALVNWDGYLELSGEDQNGDPATIPPQFLAAINNSKVNIGSNYRGSERSLSAINRAISISGGSYVELSGGLDDGDFVGSAQVTGSVLRIPRAMQLNAGTISEDNTSAVLTGDHIAKARFSTGSSPTIDDFSENVKSITRTSAGVYQVEFKRALKAGWQVFGNAEDLVATGPLSASVRHTWTGTNDAGCSVYTHVGGTPTDFNTMDLIVFGEIA